MPIKISRLLVVPILGLLSGSALARPLLTEDLNTVGRRVFEAGASISKRTDKFGDPEVKYESVQFPGSVRLGITEKLDLGFYLTYLSHRLETNSANYSGSQNGRWAPFIKAAPLNFLGFQFIWHLKEPEAGAENLPVVRGEDYEIISLIKLPTAWPVNFNVGYLFQGDYKSKLGVSTGRAFNVEPGNIFEAKGSLEIPMKLHLFLLGELAYYKSEDNRIENTTIADSAAEAMDALAGLTWSYRGWNIGAGVAFGLLEEKYTSFDLERGAGDYTVKFMVNYKLTPKKGTKS